MNYLIVDNVIIGANHIINNAGCINIIQSINNTNAIIHFYAEEKHASEVLSKVTCKVSKQIEHHPIKVIDPSGKIPKKVKSWIAKLVEDGRFIKKMLHDADADRPEFIYFCTLTPINIFRFITLFAKYPNLKIIIGIHGEVEYVFQENLSLKNKLNAWFYKMAFKNVPINVKFNVLSSLIRDRIVESKLLKENEIMWIEHPISKVSFLDKCKNNKVPIIAYLGVASERKRSQHFFEIASRFTSFSDDNLVEFKLIGKISPELQNLCQGAVNCLSKSNGTISQEEYESHCLSANYCLSFILDDDYIFRISGSVMDAIQYRIPIIALRHSYIEYLFDIGGDIGFLCNTIDEIEDVIGKIIRADKDILDRYEAQLHNLDRLSERFYDTKNVDLFKKGLSNVGWEFNEKGSLV